MYNYVSNKHEIIERRKKCGEPFKNTNEIEIFINECHILLNRNYNGEAILSVKLSGKTYSAVKFGDKHQVVFTGRCVWV